VGNGFLYIFLPSAHRVIRVISELDSKLFSFLTVTTILGKSTPEIQKIITDPRMKMLMFREENVNLNHPVSNKQQKI